MLYTKLWPYSQEYIQPGAGDDTALENIADESSRLYNRVLELLGPESEEAELLSALLSCASHMEAIEQLGISRPTFYRRLKRVVRKVRELIDDDAEASALIMPFEKE